MPQALWTQAREQLDILTIVFANREYQILRGELRNVGVTAGGPKAEALIDIGHPAIDWISLARTFGVEAFRAATADELSRHIEAGLAPRGTGRHRSHVSNAQPVSLPPDLPGGSHMPLLHQPHHRACTWRSVALPDESSVGRT